MTRSSRVYLAVRTRVLNYLRCPGLKSGWFLRGRHETWYGQRTCGRYMNPLRATYVGVCWECSAAFNRRGFRVNYDTLPKRTE